MAYRKSMLVAVFAFFSAVGGSNVALAQSGAPILTCPTGTCQVIVCGAQFCSAYVCNSGGCMHQSSWPNPSPPPPPPPSQQRVGGEATAAAQPGRPAMVRLPVLAPDGRESQTLFAFQGSGPIGVRVCSDSGCGLHVLKDGKAYAVGRTANQDREFQRLLESSAGDTR